MNKPVAQPLPYPFGLDFREWASQFISHFPEQQIPYPPREEDWWEWAAYLLFLEKFAQAPIPDRKVFQRLDSWQEWAELFIQILQA